jgi:transposase-like protein
MLEFMDKYGTEELCHQQLFNSKWPNGFICPKCSNGEYFNIKSRSLYQCKACNHQASVTAGTIMDKTRTPLVKWFLAMYLIASDKRGISALSLKSKLGTSYTTAWTISNKIRHAMGKRDESYKLSGIVELDDAFFGASSQGGKRGRGTDKTAVLVSVSLTDDGKPQYAKMEVVKNVDGETVSNFAENNISSGSEVHTDGYSTYSVLKDDGYSLVKKKYDPKNDPKHWHWTHIIISNAKSFIDGTFHGLDSLHLQRYLDEFCYRLNRRWNTDVIFTRLINACAKSCKVTYYELCG